MPITFVVSGIILILILFRYIKFKSNFKRALSLCFLILVMTSYFLGGIDSEYYSFNLLSFLSIIIFICSDIIKINTFDFVWILSFVSFYYICASSDSSCLIFYNKTYAILLILFSGVFYLFKLNKGVKVVALISFLICIVSGLIEIDSFGFSVIHFGFCIDIVFCFMIIYFVSAFILSYIFSKRGVYEKKFNNIFSSTSCYFEFN